MYLLALLALLAPALAVDRTSNPDLVSRLKTAATVLDRLALLSDTDFLFDFEAQSYATYSPGGVVNANAATFPAVVGTGMTVALLHLGPCSILPAHLHPRATNMVVSVQGQVHTWMVQENGARTVETDLTPGKLTIFPQGSVHMMQNVGCDKALLVSSLNSEDAGTHNVANALFGFQAGMLDAVFGYSGFNGSGMRIPAVGTGAGYGSMECLARCGLTPGYKLDEDK
ncbi:spherulin-1A [Trichodelitschia bisporula]|uniref:Spherulin-1A n=1 Tax=Trichodelitschia bisporula TaxID=703511 RepID=A0A6G1I1H6_9PEZI|nr:spherulin-1A [Trichodelitschia bisporula]